MVKTRRHRKKRHTRRSKRGAGLTSMVGSNTVKKKMCVALLASEPEVLIPLGMSKIQKGCDILVDKYAEMLPEIEKDPSKAVPIITKHILQNSAKMITSMADTFTQGKFSMMKNKAIQVLNEANQHIEEASKKMDEATEEQHIETLVQEVKHPLEETTET